MHDHASRLELVPIQRVGIPDVRDNILTGLLARLCSRELDQTYVRDDATLAQCKQERRKALAATTK